MSSYNDKHNSGNTEVLCWDTFVAVATVDGESYPVSLKVRTVADDTRSQIYEMATKKETGLSREAAPQNNQGLGHSSYGASPISGDTVTQDRGDVKGRYAIDETDEKPFSLDDYTIDDLLKMSDEEMESIYRKLGMGPNFELDDSILLDDDFSIDSFSEELNVEPEVVEILFRRKGLGDSHVESNRMAVMTQDRIDKRIKEHGSSNPDYARRYISRISPKDFIDMTVYERNMGRDQFDANVMGDLGSKMSEWDYEKQLRDSEEPPVLIVDQSTGQIIGHNGRHRVRALELAGIESVEIEVQFHDADGYMVKYGAETIPDMAVSSQFDTKIETHLSNIIPLNKAHRAEIMENYGETAHKDAGVRYAVDSDETDKAYLAAVESGDMETAQRMVDEAAKSAGYTVEAWHGTRSKDPFTIFRTNEKNGNFGSHFTPNNPEGDPDNPANVMGGAGTFHVYLKAQNAFETADIYADDRYWQAAEIDRLAEEVSTARAEEIRKELRKYYPLDNETAGVRYRDSGKGLTENKAETEMLEGFMRELLEAAGHDSLAYWNEREGVYGEEYDYVILNPEQIKSADPVIYDDNGNVIPLTDEFGADPNIYAALEAFIQDELKIAKRLTKELTGQSEIVMSETLAEMYLAADTDEKRDAVMEMILQDIADQIPATWGDKFQAWRYTAMLGNFRTPIRNTLGNVVMGTTALGKRAFAGIVEAGLQKVGKLDERTTSLLRDSETLKAAKDDYQTVKDIISGGGKYQDGKDQMNLQAEIRKRQRVFKNALLEGWRTKTQWVMENEYFGDAFFGQATYADALARYIAANGTTWSQASEELKDKAREVAIREAAEATFRDNNQFSKLVTSIRFRNPDTAAKKAANLVVEGVLPFKKTPANILVRATEYSPLGLVNAVAQTVAKSADKSEASISEIVDNYCKGLTGSAILGMGVMLAEMGLLQASAPDDEKEKELWGMQGHQEYAIEFSVGGKQYSYTIDWVSPVSIPLLVGAELYEAMQSKGLTKREMIDVSMAIFDPMLQMSMLQGLNDALSNAQTWGDESALTKFVGNSIWGYMTQSIPTLLGQAERASVNTRMTTYADKNKDIPDGLQRILGKASAKIPGVEYGQTVYMDAWGRTQSNASSQTLNVIEQFLSPGYANTIVESDMEKELLRLKEATDDSGVLISSAPKYFTVNQERKDLTAAEYLTYAKTRGQTAYSLLTEMTAGTTYNGMPDGEKVYAVERAYDYANQIAKELVTSVAPNKEDRYKVENWVAEARTNAAEIDLDVSTYLTAYGMTKEFVSLKDEKDETVDNSLALKKAAAVLDIPGLSKEQRVALADALGSNKTVLGWLKNNPNVIKSKLAALEKKYG